MIIHNQFSNLRLSVMDAVYQAMTPKPREPEIENPRNLPKGVQTTPGWRGEAITDVQRSEERGVAAKKNIQSDKAAQVRFNHLQGMMGFVTTTRGKNGKKGPFDLQ